MKVCKKVCVECPFKKDSLKGWLGEHTVQGILDSQQYETPFTCHMQRDNIKDHNEIDLCRGLFISANKSFKLMGQNPNFGKEMLEIQKTTRDDSRENILSRREFLDHHTLNEDSFN